MTRSEESHINPADSGHHAMPKATRKEWIGLATLWLPCMLYSMDLTVLNLAVPELARALKPSAGQLLWIIDIYGFMVAGFLMVMGSLGDRIGRRKILLIGAASFGVASVFAAFAETASQLIVARAILGIAGATLAPSTLSLITSMFRDPRERTFAISLWIMSFSVGGILGPVIGGLLIEYFWWGSVFLIAVPIMIALLIAGPLLLPEYRDSSVTKLELPSALLSLASVLSFIYGVKNSAEYGVSLVSFAAILAGLMLAAAFVRRQARLETPLIDLSLFRVPVFSLSLGINLSALFFMFGAFVFIAQYFQLVGGLSPLAAGLWSLPSAIAFAIVSPFTSKLVTKFSAHSVMVWGLGISAAGFLLLAFVSGVPAIAITSILFSVGFTPVVALTTSFVVGSVPVGKAGVASALSETGSELGGALGIALLGSLVAVIYRLKLSTMALPELSGELEASARSTLAGAVEAARHISPQAADLLLVAARDAFSDSLRVIALLAALMLAGLTVLAARILARAEVGSHG